MAFVCGFQVRAAAPVQLRRICLYPSPDAARVHGQPSFGENLGNVQVCQRIPQIPADRDQDYLARTLAALERIRRADRHRVLTLTEPPANFATEPLDVNSGKERNIATVTNVGNRFTASPYGGTILFDNVKQSGSDLMIVDDLR